MPVACGSGALRYSTHMARRELAYTVNGLVVILARGMLPTVVDPVVECEVDEVIWHSHKLTWDEYRTPSQAPRRTHTDKDNNIHNARSW